LALATSGSQLRLLSLLGGLSLGLLLLALLDSGGASGGTGLGALGALLLDHIERSTNDATLLLNGTAGALLGDFLRDTLAVLATVQDSPGDATGVLSLQEQRLGLAVLESEDLAVTTDIDLTLSLKRIR
jgi:hypothetical protein